MSFRWFLPVPAAKTHRRVLSRRPARKCRLGLEILEDRMTPATVTNLLDSGDGSLRDAIANTAAGGIVDFDASLTGMITLTSGQLVINKSLTVQGPGADRIAISGNDVSRIFEITDGTGTVINVSISGLELRNGLGTGGTAGNNAGAISLPGNENVTLDGLYVHDSVTAGNGGAIRIVDGNLTILNSTFANNRSLAAGPSTTNGGGAIKTATGLDSLTIRNSTFTGNSANAAGGALNLDGGDVIIETSTITNNTANADNLSGEPGGGISLIGTGAARTLRSTIVAGNRIGPSSTPSDISGTFIGTNVNNLIGRGLSGSNINDGENGNQVGPDSGTPLDPLLGAFQDNGGPMPTFSLQAGSPALDQGSNPSSLSNDQRGAGYARVAGTAADVGAFEAQLGITSAANATFTAGTAGTFTVATLGDVTGVSSTGSLPAGVTLVYNNDGTATLAGTPAAGSGGVYTLTLTASGVGPDATQTFTLTVNEAPTITGAAATTFNIRQAGSHHLTATGYPAAITFSTASALPAGVTLSASGLLSGTPTVSGTFAIAVVASNGVTPNATRTFTLTVQPQTLPASQVFAIAPLLYWPLGGGRFQGTFTLINLTKTTITGPVTVALTNLPKGVSVVSTTTVASLKPGQIAQVKVVFDNPQWRFLGFLGFSVFRTSVQIV